LNRKCWYWYCNCFQVIFSPTENLYWNPLFVEFRAVTVHVDGMNDSSRNVVCEKQKGTPLVIAHLLLVIWLEKSKLLKKQLCMTNKILHFISRRAETLLDSARWFDVPLTLLLTGHLALFYSTQKLCAENRCLTHALVSTSTNSNRCPPSDHSCRFFLVIHYLLVGNRYSLSQPTPQIKFN